MIKYLVCDLDDTLLYKHGEDSLFDITARNKEALKALQHSGIHFCIASGRTYLHGKKILEMFELIDGGLCCGLNGSIYYDNNELVNERYLNNDDVIKMIEIVEEYPNDFFNMQIQDVGENRNYYYPNMPPAFKYQKEIVDLGIGIWDETPLKEAILNNPNMKIAKYSIVSDLKESSSKLEALLRKEYGEKYTITRSNSGYLEVTNKEAYKGNFIKYIKAKYQITADEIAVIGDNCNDVSMFEESNVAFCMAQADDSIKGKARFVVSDVAECISKCIKYNETQSWD